MKSRVAELNVILQGAIQKKALPTTTDFDNFINDASLPDIKNLFNDSVAIPDDIGQVSNEELKNLFKTRPEIFNIPPEVNENISSAPTPAPSAAPTPAPSAAPSSASTQIEPESGPLKRGHKGERVKMVQQKLYDKGFRLSIRNNQPDGTFGKGTRNAVIYFQVLNGIDPADGVVGEETLSKLNSGNYIGPNDTKDPMPGREKLVYTEEDVDAAARGIVVETAFVSDYKEMAGIVWVMVNRAKKWNMSIRDVIHPDTGGGRNWYGGLSKNNRKRWKNASNRKDFEYIKGFVRKILDGISFENEIGDRVHFLHPGGMARCSTPETACGSRNHRQCVDTATHGNRCLPKWNIEGNTNMAGDVRVLNIGRARFS